MGSRTSVDLGIKQYEKSNNMNLGVWVYTGLESTSVFKRFDTMIDAVKEAIKHRNAYVLHNGKEITYGRMNGNVIYYKTPENKVVFAEVDT